MRKGIDDLKTPYFNLSRLFFILVTLATVHNTIGQDSKKMVSELFSSHMVLQRNHEIPVWGIIDPGHRVTLTLENEVFHSDSDNEGYWRIVLPPQNSGGPFTMEIKSGVKSIELVDIYFGDVWLCSGQSNMEWPLEKTKNATNTFKNSPYPTIRHLKIPKSSSLLPDRTLVNNEGWKVAMGKDLKNFTAVGFYFAQHIQKDIKVPIGLLNSTWGGSKIVSWMDARALGYPSSHELKKTIEKEQKALKAKQIHNFLTVMSKVPFKELGLDTHGNNIWQHPALDDSTWKQMYLPSPWEKQGLNGLDGIVWFRKSFYVTEVPSQDEPCYISLGAIDDSDETYLNGKKIGGETNTWNLDRVYDFPSELLKPGNNLIAIKVKDDIQRGGFQAKDSSFYVRFGKHSASLVGPWKYKVAYVKEGNLGKENHKMPSLIYNKMIYPLHSFPIKGILWYQGESDANKKDAFVYRERFQRLIRSWRDKWKNHQLPFLFVQLANYNKNVSAPVPSNWAILRDSQHNALALNATAEVVTIDLGEADNIHPRNKKDVGKRLALAAKTIAYDENINYQGPVLSSFEIKDGKIILHFKNDGSEILNEDSSGNLNGFTISGADRKFYKAEARLVNQSVIVWCKSVPRPVAIRYAWSDNPEKANLYNTQGLPASPFRTDDWEE